MAILIKKGKAEQKAQVFSFTYENAPSVSSRGAFGYFIKTPQSCRWGNKLE